MPKNSDTLKKAVEKYQILLFSLFLIFATALVYFQVQDFEFINYDDDDYVTANQYVKDGLSIDGIVWALTTTRAGNWHPLTWVSHMVDVELFGLNPGAHHLINLAFHIANTLILFLVFSAMTGSRAKSACVAALFALHPVHVESVAWVAERKDVLSAFFWMLTLWSYAEYTRRPSFFRYLWVMLFFVLGLLSKPMVVTLPCVLLLLDYWPLNRIQFHSPADSVGRFPKPAGIRVVVEKIPLFVFAALSSAATFYAQKQGGAVVALETIPLAARIANSLVSYTAYIGKMVFPVNLGVIYPHARIFHWWEVAGAGMILLLMSAMSVRALKKHPYFSVGWFWFLGTLVPVIGIVQVGSQAMADRYTYIPYIGLFIIFSWGLPNLLKQWRQSGHFLAAGAIAVLTLLAVLTWRQTGYWKSSLTLFEHTLAVTSDNYTAHNNLGSALYARGNIDDALRHYRQAVKINPDYAKGHYNLGVLLEQKGDRAGAVRQYREAIRIYPDFDKARFNLGVLLEAKGQNEEALKQYLKVVQINSQYYQAYNNLAGLLVKNGQVTEAVNYFKKALEIDPNYVKAHFGLGVACNRLEKYDQAVAHYRQALALDPGFEQARNNLCIALFYSGKTQNALDCFEESVKINPDNRTARENYKNALLFLKNNR